MPEEVVEDSVPGGTIRTDRPDLYASVLTATRELMVEVGPDGFSVRDIAARVGISHSLIHRHFNSKADILRSLMDDDSRLLAESVAAVRDFTNMAEVLAVLERFPAYFAAIAHAVMSDREHALPGTEASTEAFAAQWKGGDPAASVRSALAGVMVMGWLTFGQFMAESTGADPEEVRRELAARISALMMGQR